MYVMLFHQSEQRTPSTLKNFYTVSNAAFISQLVKALFICLFIYKLLTELNCSITQTQIQAPLMQVTTSHFMGSHNKNFSGFILQKQNCIDIGLITARAISLYHGCH